MTEILRPYVDFSGIPPAVLAAAADRGIRCHAAIASHLMDEFPVVDRDVRPYFDSFMRWADRMIKDVVLVERRFVDEAFRFTGQIDLVARLNGDAGWTLIDFKTGQIGQKSWRIQVAAYRRLAEKNGIPTMRGMSIRLKKNGAGVVLDEYPRCFNADFGLFVGILNAHYYFKPKTDIDWEAI